MEWMDIETAPKAGTFSVGVWVDSTVAGGMRWSSWSVNTDDPSFPSFELGCDGEFGDPPTHWAPLPQPPTPRG